MEFVNVSYEKARQIAIVTMNRPEKKHAFHTEMAQQLLTAFQKMNEGDVRVVIFTSSTTDAFCSGADLKERKGMSDEAWKEQHHLFEQMFLALAAIKCPTISAMCGYALAGGFELALNTDLLIAGENVKVGLSEVRRGIMPGGGGARLLPKRIPLHIAKEWLFTGRIIEASEAERAGLFNRVVAVDEVMPVALALAEEIANNAPIGVRGVKKVADCYTLPADDAFKLEMDMYEQVIHTADRLEGILAFNEKRQPKFVGR